MKEFIEKLIAKLEEIPTKNKCSECPHKQKCDEIEAMDKDEQIDLCGATIKALAIEEVNELAEEYKLLENIEQLNNGWIPCSERLPDVGVTVLCYWGKSSIFENTTSYYYTLMHRNEDNIWISDFGICTGFVISWMPLPEPYKEGVTENE